jgi:type IV secretory pathway VirJ component
VRLFVWPCLVVILLGPNADAAQSVMSHGRFATIHVYEPVGVAEQFVMLLAGEDAAAARRLAVMLSSKGALVAAVDTRAMFDNLEKDDSECVSPDGDLENLSHFIQAAKRLPAYHAPILVGEGAGAVMVYAMLAQAPKATFAGGISLEFCPELLLRKSLCKDNRLDYLRQKNHTAKLLPKPLEQSWSVVDSGVACASDAHSFANQTGISIAASSGSTAQLDAVAQSYSRLARSEQSRATLPQALAELPLTEVVAAKRGDTLAILLSGDGGWAGLDKQVAAAIAQQGISVIGLDSLRYFWNERTPEDLARDLDRIVRAYTQQWYAKRVVLIGYSQGADVLPFAINRMDPAIRAAIATAVLIGPGTRAKFEFQIGNWLGLDAEGLPIAPEVRKLRSTRLVCIQGVNDEDAQCDALMGANAQTLKLPGGHHFDGDYEGLASAILQRIRK